MRKYIEKGYKERRKEKDTKGSGKKEKFEVMSL